MIFCVINLSKAPCKIKQIKMETSKTGVGLEQEKQM
jgi:hypothetical protein